MVVVEADLIGGIRRLATEAESIQEGAGTAGQCFGHGFVDQDVKHRVQTRVEDREEDESDFDHVNGRSHLFNQLGHGQDDEDPVGHPTHEKRNYQTQ